MRDLGIENRYKKWDNINNIIGVISLYGRKSFHIKIKYLWINNKLFYYAENT